jgi:sugar lactone lactonase YvrE/mono/diheme cytochrome c family protein
VASLKGGKKMISRIASFTAALAIGAAALMVGGPLLAQDAPRTIWSGVYSEAQAARGRDHFNQSCASCHGVQLTGTGEAPPLSGAEFMANWNGLTMGDMFERVRTTMPMDRPNSLSRDAYADVLAYVLQYNGAPSGPNDLDRRPAYLAAIGITASKPSGAAAAAPAPVAANVSTAAKPAAATMPASTISEAAKTPVPNSQPNPYTADTGFFKLPAGRTMGSSSAVATDSRGHIWIAERCGANSCANSTIDPIMEFDAKGNFIKAFGGGLFLFPHGFFIDKNDNIWVTDGRIGEGKGNQIFQFDRTGKVLRTLGKAGIAGDGPDVFNEPNSVLVAPNGTIFVGDGHTANKGNARVMKFDASGKFIKQWGGHGAAPGQMDVPHTLAMDSKGRLFVGDRWNNRIQIFDQDGNLLDIWTQFGRPSGLYIDKNDILYSADSESREPQGYGYNPGWKRGIRIGSVKDGVVTAFIPDTELNPDKGATSGAEGVWANNGVVYGAQVLQKSVVRYTKK